jgi:nucleotide-binding universal stress UspA family protein
MDWERRHHQQSLESLLRAIRTEHKAVSDALDYLKPRTHLLQGSASREIPKLAKNLAVDCIVMGTVGRTGIRGILMGNTAETILAQIDSSVLAIKPEGFSTPIALED